MGLYKLDNISNEGEHCQNYNIITSSGATYFSDFIEINGSYITKKAFVYYFTFDGSSITLTDTRPFIF
jgi:hypothetical protein